jgi:hypothetical protein
MFLFLKYFRFRNISKAHHYLLVVVIKVGTYKRCSNWCDKFVFLSINKLRSI